MNSRIRSLFIVHTSMFIMALGSSIIFTGIWPYLILLDSDVRDELGLYGFVVAADALAQMIFSPIFGILSDKLGQIRIVSMICAGTFTIGNVMYALASLVPQDLWGIHIPRLWFVLATRFIVGMGTSINATARAYVSKVTTLEERTTHVSLISLFQSMGFILGPAVQAALSPIGSGEPNPDSHITFNLFTATGWVSTCTGTICFILFLPGIFVEHQNAGNDQPTKSESTPKALTPPASESKDGQNGFSKERKRSYVVPMVPKEVLMLRKIEAGNPKPANKQLLKQFSTISVLDGMSYADFNHEEEENSRQLPSKPKKPNSFVVFVACWSFFGAFCSFVVMEALATPLAIDQWGWTEEDAVLYLGIILASGGVLSAFFFGSIGPLSKRIDERLLLILIGITPMLISRLVWYPMGSEKPPYIGNYTECGYEGPDDPALPYAVTGAEPGCAYCWCLELNALTIPQFMIGFVFNSVGYPYSVALIGAILSKIVGRYKPGVYMGLLTMSGSFARVLGPVFLVWIYSSYGTVAAFYLIAALQAISIVLLLVTYKKLVPPGQDYTVSAIKKKNSVCPPDGSARSSRMSSRRPSRKPDPEPAGPTDVFKAINS